MDNQSADGKNQKSDEEELKTENRSAEGKDMGEPISQQDKTKMLLYKLFFFNYVFSVSGQDIVNSLLSEDRQDDFEQHAFNMKADIYESGFNVPKNIQERKEEDEKAQEANHKTVLDLINSFFIAIQTLKDRALNLKND